MILSRKYVIMVLIVVILLTLSSMAYPATARISLGTSTTLPQPKEEEAITSLKSDMRVDSILLDYVLGKISPENRIFVDSMGRPRIFVLAENSALESLLELVQEGVLEILWVLPLPKRMLLASCLLEKDVGALSELLGVNGLIKVSADYALAYGKSKKIVFAETGSIIATTPNASLTPPLEDEATPAITSYVATRIMGAPEAWDLGYKGENITIAIVDTGVDYAVPNLVHSVSVDEYGSLKAFDADELGLTILYRLSPSRVYENASGTYLAVKGAWYSFLSYTGGFVELQMESDIEVTGKVNASTPVSFGIFLATIPGSYYIYIIPVTVVAVDSDIDGVFDTVYADLSTAAFIYGMYVTVYEGMYVWWLDPSLMDFSIVDEPALVLDQNDPTKAIAARDFDGDGRFDFSIGAMGAPFADIQGAIRFMYGLGELVYPGLDSEGRWVNFALDYYGHGTGCAGSAAGDDNTTFYMYFVSNGTWIETTLPGIAPKAKVMSVVSLWMGNVVEGWLYASGFDPISQVIDLFGVQVVLSLWYYTGNHKADVISNSWGISSDVLDYFGKLFGMDILSLVETFLSIPGSAWNITDFTDPYYPGVLPLLDWMMMFEEYNGTLFTHAVGNGGPSYGTANTGPLGFMAVQVGASTTYHWRPFFSIEPEGYYDQIIPWSNRGPFVTGQPSPDVVSIGAFAFASAPISSGGVFGVPSGEYAYQLFGGTSQATPYTAGAAAIVIEAYKEKYGVTPYPALVKSFLMAGADDLGYDAFSQGAGRINVRKAVEVVECTNNRFAVLGTELFEKLAWRILGTPPATPPEDSIVYPALYFEGTTVDPINETVSLKVYGNTTIDNYEAVKIVKYYESTCSLTFSPATIDEVANYTSEPYYYVWFKPEILFPDVTPEIVANATYVRIIAYTDALTSLQNILGIYFAMWNWTDYDGDGIADNRSEVHLVNRDTNIGNILTVEVGYPAKYKNPLIGFFLGAFKYATQNITFNIVLQFYNCVEDESFTIVPKVEDGVTKYFNVTLDFNVSKPGFYERYLVFSNSDHKQLVPVVINIVEILGVNDSSYYSGMFEDQDEPFENFYVMLGYNWYWRPEVGEWRIFYVKVEDSTSRPAWLNISASWNDPLTFGYIQVYDAETGDYVISGYTGYIFEGLYLPPAMPCYGTNISAPIVTNRTYIVIVHIPLIGGFLTLPEYYSISFNVSLREEPIVQLLKATKIASADSYEASFTWIYIAPEGISSIKAVTDVGVEAEVFIIPINNVIGYIIAEMNTLSLAEGFRSIKLDVETAFAETSREVYFIVDRSPPKTQCTIDSNIWTGGNATFAVVVEDYTPISGTIVLSELEDIYGESRDIFTISWELDLDSYIESGGTVVNVESQITPNVPGIEEQVEVEATYSIVGDGLLRIVFNVVVLDGAWDIIPDGKLVVSSQCNDYIGNYVESISDTIILDTKPPEIEVYGIPEVTSGDFEITGEIIDAQPWEVELYIDNQLVNTTMPVSIRTPVEVYDTISPKDVYKMYSMSLMIGETTSVVLEWDDPTVDLDLYVLDEDFNVIGYSVGTTTYEEVDFVATYTGTYYIVVDYYSGDATTEYYLVANAMKYGAFVFYVNTTGLDEGKHEISIKGFDQVGRYTWYNTTFTLDRTPPCLNIEMEEAPVTEGYYNSNFNISIYTSDAMLSEVDVYLDGILVKYYIPAATEVADTIVINVTDLWEGQHNITIIAWDAAGLVNTWTGTFIVDYSSPTVLPWLGEYYVSNSINISFNVYDSIGLMRVEAYLDSEDYLIAVFNITDLTEYEDFLIVDTSSIPDGDHVVIFKVFDLAGNVENASVSFVSDNTPPTVDLEAATEYALNNIPVRIEASDSIGILHVTVLLNGEIIGEWEISEQASFVADLNVNVTALGEGAYEIRAMVFDVVGHSSDAVVQVIVDRTAPSATAIVPSGVQNNTFNMEIVASDNVGLAHVVVRVDGREVLNVAFEENVTVYSTTITVVVADLDDGSHVVEVEASDLVGLRTISSATFVTDKSRPSITIVPARLDKPIAGSITFTLQASDNIELKSMEAYIDGSLLATWNLTGLYDEKVLTIDTTGLSDGNHTLAIRVIDEAGNVVRRELSFTSDNTAPTASIECAVAGQEVTAPATLNFTWSTDVVKARLIMTLPSGDVTEIDVSNVDHMTVDFTKMGDGTYTFKLVVTDAAGNTGESSPVSIINAYNSHQADQARQSGTTMGGAVGAVIGLVVGAAVLTFIMRRK